jgi:hypothetical protein
MLTHFYGVEFDAFSPRTLISVCHQTNYIALRVIRFQEQILASCSLTFLLQYGPMTRSAAGYNYALLSSYFVISLVEADVTTLIRPTYPMRILFLL